MVAGAPPIRAKKARYFDDAQFRERLLAPPLVTTSETARSDDWSSRPLPPPQEIDASRPDQPPKEDDLTESEPRLQPELSRVKPIEKKAPLENEFTSDVVDDDIDDDASRMVRMNRLMQGVAKQASLDPADGMDL